MDCLMGKKLVSKSGEEVAADDVLKDVEVICFYFSAHWCPPCRMFTPILADFYNDLKNNNEKVEIVFISSDRSEDDMLKYLREDHGSWFAIKFSDPLAQELKQKYSIRGIPSLIVVTREGKLITTDGRMEIHKSGTACFQSWCQKGSQK